MNNLCRLQLNGLSAYARAKPKRLRFVGALHSDRSGRLTCLTLQSVPSSSGLATAPQRLVHLYQLGWWAELDGPPTPADVLWHSPSSVPSAHYR